MKRLLILCVMCSLILLGCATTTYKETARDGSTREVTVKRPIFAATAVAWTGLTGNINSASSVDLNQMLGAMLAGYLASQTVPVGPVVK